MFPKHIVPTVRAVMRFVKARVHKEGNAAAKGRNAEPDEATPQICCISAFLVNYGGHIHFAAWTLDVNWEVKTLSPK